jgi:hypothetical protein
LVFWTKIGQIILCDCWKAHPEKKPKRNRGKEKDSGGRGTPLSSNAQGSKPSTSGHTHSANAMVLSSTLSAPLGFVSQPVTLSSTLVIGHLATLAVSSSNSPNVHVVDNSISGSYYETSVTTTSITWLMDSGASCHVMPHWSDFIEYHLLNNPKRFGTAVSGHGVFAEGVGVIAGYVDMDGRLISTRLTNVYHIPQVAT